MSHLTVHDVEAFVADGLSGNPAGVALLDGPLADDVMLHVAKTMGYSETAFLVPSGEAGRYGLRWFTPEVEIALCGHATLASAQTLFQVGGVDADVLTFDTLSGPLHAVRDGDQIRLDFPQDHGAPYEPPPALLDALRLSTFSSAARSSTGRLLIELADEREVRAVEPDFDALLRLPADLMGHGVIVTAAASAPYDFVSRFFHPYAGIPEDPVTGSAHCLLATFWSARLDRDALVGLQCSDRGGVVRTRLVEPGRVHLTGAARIVGKEQIPLPRPI